MADCSATLDLSEALKRLGEDNQEAAAAKAKKTLHDLDNISLNIAVTGETGAGKSAFVNAFRGLDDDEDMSAPTGVTETTQEVRMYPHPTKPNVKLWDLPGIGMPKLNADQFLKDVNFETYDIFIIISSARFKENDVFLAKEIKKKQKHFYFVRSKIDNDIDSVARRKHFDEQRVLHAIREDCCKNLKEVENPKVFLISNYDLGKYDFQNLVDTIESDLVEHQRYALVQSLPVCSLAMLVKKKQMMEKFVWLAALASGFVGYVSLPVLPMLLDRAVLVSFFTSCHYMFGLDNQSLVKLSERVNKPVSQLKSAIKSPLTSAMLDKLKVMPQIPMTTPVTSIENLLDTKLMQKRGQNAVTAFNNMYNVLSEGLDEMVNDMTQVLREAGLD